MALSRAGLRPGGAGGVHDDIGFSQLPGKLRSPGVAPMNRAATKHAVVFEPVWPAVNPRPMFFEVSERSILLAARG